MKELLFFGSTGVNLLRTIKNLKGRSPDKIEKIDEDNVKLTVDNETFVIPIKLLKLMENKIVRESLAGMVENPLQKKGIDKFMVTDGDQIEEVSKEESSYFAVPNSTEDKLVDDVHKIVYSIVSLSFKETNKWRLFDGNRTHYVQICDRDFLQKVKNSEVSFSKGDVLVCLVRFRQFQVLNELKSETIVEKIIEHIPANRLIQPSLIMGRDD